MNDSDRTRDELLKLSEALLLCQRELAQLRTQQEQWEERFSQLSRESAELAERMAQLAGAAAQTLADNYWRSRGRFPPMSLRDVAISRWPWLRRWLGRKPSPEVATEMQQVGLLESSALFDARWYLEHNPDVAAAGIHPALHYLQSGAAEGREPGPDFDSHAYRRLHPEPEAQANPLLHRLQSADV